ncbi:MAG: cobalt-zinc-cadmium efflux system outer membrane protein [Planctomycetota bacterium]|jgi:cobalt-zinc-cadmium efflux system outer membrane protein
MDRVAERGLELPLGSPLDSPLDSSLDSSLEPSPGAGQAEPPTFDLSNGATLPECEALAQFYNADLRLARAQAGVAQANKDNAGLWKDPVFGFNGDQVLSPSTQFEYGASLSVTLPISGRLRVQKDRARAALDVQWLKVADAEWRLRADLRVAYFRWHALTERSARLAELIDQVSRIDETAEGLAAAGSLGRAQARLIHIELVGRRAELLRVQLEADLARVGVLGLIGLAPDAAIELMEPSLATLASPMNAVDASPETLHSTSTELALLRGRYELAEETLRLAIQQQYPDLTLGLGPGSEGNDTRVGIGLSLPIPLFNRNAQAIAAARAQRDVARVAAEVALERIARDVERATVTLDSVGRQREAIVNELSPLLDDQTGTINALAELGDVDAFLLLQTFGRRYDAASRVLDLELSEAAARIQLALLVGPPNSDSPSPAAPSAPEASDATEAHQP